MIDDKQVAGASSDLQGSTSEPPPVTDEERQLAQQAKIEFDKGSHDACLALLGKLASLREWDPKIMHNKVVTTYYKSNFTKTDEFKQSMETVCSKAHVNVENIAALEDVDQCVFYYNYAVILYHTRQYESALNILDKLFQYVEPLTLQRKAMFLLIEIFLCTQQPDRALGIIAYMEKVMFGNGISQQSPEKEEGKPADEPDVNDVWKPRISMYKAKCFMMMKSLKSCKREIKTLVNSTGMNTPILYIKSNFEYLRGNYRKAIKFLNSAPQSLKTTAETGENLAAIYYNNMGVIHFYMRKHNLGAFYFRKAMHENEVCSAEFNKAQYGKSLSGRPVQTIGVSRHYELMYNMGIQMLHCGQPKAAFDCLVQTINMYHLNPRLWLRLAECCIMAYKSNNDEDRKLNVRMSVVQGSIGTGVHRKLILGPGVQKQCDPGELSSSAAIPVATLEFASLCLSNALMLLPEDPLNVPTSSSEDAAETRPAHENSVGAPPGSPMKNYEVANLRCSILAASAYTALCLNDFIMALQHAENLLKQPRLSGAQRYCGNLYKAEALVALDRIADAVSHLNPDNVTDIGTASPEPKGEQDKSERNGDRDPQETTEAKGALYPWSPRDLPRAKAIMQYNLATAHAIRGEYEKALMQLSKSTQSIGLPLPAQMYFLKLYLELMEGHRKIAQGIIKEHFGHVTPNRV